MNILSKFPRKLTPRPVQKAALEQLEKHWHRSDIFVVNLPVASGKSAIAMTVARWAGQASIITPTKLLVDQYKQEYKSVQVLRAKSDYWCDTFDVPVSKRPQSKKTGKLCKADMGCGGCQVYLKDLRKARVMPFLLSNYYIYLAHRLYRDVLIIDEAHTMIDMLKNMNAKIFWQFKHKFPSNLKTRADVKAWINSLPTEAFNYHYKMDGERVWTSQEQLAFLKRELNSYRPKYLVEVREEDYRGEPELRIKLTPVDISDCPPIMWPSQVKKIIFLSATMNRKDIEQLGLGSQRIQYISADSPITSERRPVLIPETAQSMSLAVQNKNLSSLARFIIRRAESQPNEKGLIHATYGLADKLKAYEWPNHIRDRILFHGRTDKTLKYNEFRKTDEPKILVASGMYEGIDLPYDAGRWQVLAKVPWPSLGDPAIKYLSTQDEEWYLWETLKTTLQACGRICRTPEDYGETWIFDKSFDRAYEEGVSSGLIPEWFQRSVFTATEQEQEDTQDDG